MLQTSKPSIRVKCHSGKQVQPLLAKQSLFRYHPQNASHQMKYSPCMHFTRILRTLASLPLPWLNIPTSGHKWCPNALSRDEVTRTHSIQANCKISKKTSVLFSQWWMMTSLKQFGISARSLLQEPASHYELLPDTCELEVHCIPPWTLVLYIREFECHHIPPLTLIWVCTQHLWVGLPTHNLKTVTWIPFWYVCWSGFRDLVCHIHLLSFNVSQPDLSVQFWVASLYILCQFLFEKGFLQFWNLVIDSYYLEPGTPGTSQILCSMPSGLE